VRQLRLAARPARISDGLRDTNSIHRRRAPFNPITNGEIRGDYTVQPDEESGLSFESRADTLAVALDGKPYGVSAWAGASLGGGFTSSVGHVEKAAQCVMSRTCWSTCARHLPGSRCACKANGSLSSFREAMTVLFEHLHRQRKVAINRLFGRGLAPKQWAPQVQISDLESPFEDG
jgi:hypothetical protein